MDKERLRQEAFDRCEERPAEERRDGWGKAAERLRRIDSYRTARTVLAPPVASLFQVRLNVLTDRKRLVMPSPGLQKGFLLVDPGRVPLKDRIQAVQPGPRNSYAAKIPYASVKGPSGDAPARTTAINMIITEAVAVGMDGSCLGDGQGHLDLQYAILGTLGWVDERVQIAALVEECRVRESVPMEPTDVGIHWIVTPERVLRTSCTALPSTGIVWSMLTRKQIKRNDALFHLHGAIEGQRP